MITVYLLGSFYPRFSVRMYIIHLYTTHSFSILRQPFSSPSHSQSCPLFQSPVPRVPERRLNSYTHLYKTFHVDQQVTSCRQAPDQFVCISIYNLPLFLLEDISGRQPKQHIYTLKTTCSLTQSLNRQNETTTPKSLSSGPPHCFPFYSFDLLTLIGRQLPL